MTRSVEEWVGKSDDEPFPPRVRLRIFERAKGICQECGRKIGPADKWIADHEIALCNGGENREGNGRCICDWCDKNVKTPADVAIKKHGTQVRYRHQGIRPKSKWQSRGFPPAQPRHEATRAVRRKSEDGIT